MQINKNPKVPPVVLDLQSITASIISDLLSTYL